MAPPSARQLASPMRLKFSSPLSPSISVTQLLSPMPAQPDRASAESMAPAVMTVLRSIIVSPFFVDDGRTTLMRPDSAPLYALVNSAPHAAGHGAAVHLS